LLNLTTSIIPIQGQQGEDEVVLFQRNTTRVYTDENFRDILFLCGGLDVEHRKRVAFQIDHTVDAIRN